jgi:hypothetical protein
MKYRKNKSDEKYGMHTLVRNEFNSKIRKITENYWEVYISYLQRDFCSTQKQV